MADGRRTIRFFPDWGHRWPLWESFSEQYTMRPEELGLSERLTVWLREWYDFWGAHLDPFEGWDDRSNAEAWRAEGQALTRGAAT